MMKPNRLTNDEIVFFRALLEEHYTKRDEDGERRAKETDAVLAARLSAYKPDRDLTPANAAGLRKITPAIRALNWKPRAKKAAKPSADGLEGRVARLEELVQGLERRLSQRSEFFDQRIARNFKKLSDHGTTINALARRVVKLEGEGKTPNLFPSEAGTRVAGKGAGA